MKKESYIGLIQENSIEFLVQNSLSYIIYTKLLVHAIVLLTYPKGYVCCGNHWSQKPIETQSINLKDRYCCRDHKRTQQEISTELLPYLYKLQIVCTANN